MPRGSVDSSLAPEANENSYLVGPEGRMHNTRLQPRLVFNNFDMLAAVAVDGPAVALLPEQRSQQGHSH